MASAASAAWSFGHPRRELAESNCDDIHVTLVKLTHGRGAIARTVGAARRLFHVVRESNQQQPGLDMVVGP